MVQIEDAAISQMADVVRFSKVRSVKIAEAICVDSEVFIEAAYDNHNIKKLDVDKIKLPKRIWDIIYNGQHITDLRLANAEFPKLPNDQNLKIACLTRLDLKGMKEVPTSLLLAAKSSETLKELHLESSKDLFPVISDILSINTVLKKLSLVMPLSAEEIDAISVALTNNRSLKGLEILLPQNSAQLLCQGLVLNDTLEELAIVMPHEFITEDYYSSFGSVFATNSSLRSIKLPTTVDKVAADNMIAKLKNNDTLTHLDLVLPGPAFTSNYVYSELTTVLHENRALNQIQSVGEIKKKVVDMVAENKRKQQEFVKLTYSLINMMKLRLEAFEDIAPLEVWSMIFKQLRHPGVNIDFSNELLTALKK